MDWKPRGWAQQTSLVGQWKTIDDESGEAKSILAIAEENGTFSATIEKILVEKADGSAHICNNCTGDLEGAPMEGLRIVWHMRADGNGWGGILDPVAELGQKARRRLPKYCYGERITA